MNKESVQAVDNEEPFPIPGITYLVPECVESCRKDILDIMDGLTHDDYTKVARMGHNIAGAGAVCSFDVIHNIGVAIELSAEQRDSNKVKKYSADLLSYLGLIGKVYKVSGIEQ